MVENNHSPNNPPISPLRYESSFEQLEKNEDETDAALAETMPGISEITFKDSGRGLRSVHAKSHGLLTGSLHVLNDLPSVLAQGIAASPRTYPVVIRLSTTPSDILDDSVSTRAQWRSRLSASRDLVCLRGKAAPLRTSFSRMVLLSRRGSLPDVRAATAA